METIAELLGLPMPAVSEAYLTADEGDLDLRPNEKRARTSRPRPIFRSSPTACLSRLIFRSQTFCFAKAAWRSESAPP